MSYTPPRNWHGDTLIAAADLNEQIRDNFAYLATATPPVGALVAVDGGALPDKYAAAVGGPAVDMRDRLILGAGGAIAINAAGGADVPTALPAHSAHAVGQPGTHVSHIATNPFNTHGQPQNDVGSGGGGDPSPWQQLSPHSAPTISAHGAHTGQDLSAHDAHAAISILPPYVERVFAQCVTPADAFTTPRTWVTSEVPTIAMLNQELRDNPKHLIARALQVRVMAFWNAAGAPTGWNRADGTNGTFSTLDTFLRGTDGSHFNVGGGVNATIPAHANHVATQAANHADHTISIPDHTGVSQPTQVGTFFQSRVSTLNHVPNISPHNGHDAFGVDAHSAHAAMAILPPYLALAYIELLTVASIPTPRTWVTGEIISASLFNLYVRDVVAGLKAREVPIGAILGWVGAASGWPANYHLCDGAASTPDARGKYIVGGGVTYAVGSTGGAGTVTPAAHSTHTLTEGSTHGDHNVLAPDHVVSPRNNFTSFGKHTVAQSHNPTISSGTHTHSGSTVDGHSAHSAITLAPAYRGVALIQRQS